MILAFALLQGDEPNPKSVLVNGMAQAKNCTKTNTCKYPKLKGVASDCSDPKSRLRIVNSGGLEVTNVTIDGHRMIIVGVDAVPVEPVEVSEQEVNTSQVIHIVHHPVKVTP